MMPNKEQIKASSKAANAAEDILKGLFEGKEAPKPSVGNMSRTLSDNLSNIKVPDSLVETITGVRQSKPKPKPVEKLNEEVVSKKVEDLISRLSTILKEAHTLLGEMTTVGMIGTGYSVKKKAQRS